MSDEKSHEHHTRPPRPAIPLEHGAEHSRDDQPLPNDTSLVDRQIERWLWPHYRHNIAYKILAETSPDPQQRPGKSALARRWEARVAELANDPTYDELDMSDDPYRLVLEACQAAVAGNPQMAELVTRLGRLYKARQTSMTTRQQYEAPLPENLDRLLEIIFEQMQY